MCHVTNLDGGFVNCSNLIFVQNPNNEAKEIGQFSVQLHFYQQFLDIVFADPVPIDKYWQKSTFLQIYFSNSM